MFFSLLFPPSWSVMWRADTFHWLYFFQRNLLSFRLRFLPELFVCCIGSSVILAFLLFGVVLGFGVSSVWALSCVVVCCLRCFVVCGLWSLSIVLLCAGVVV